MIRALIAALIRALVTALVRALVTALVLALPLVPVGCGRVGGAGIPSAQVAALYDDLIADDEARVESAVERVEAARDERFVAVLIELLRASQLGIAGRHGYNRRVVALERISGQTMGGDWFAWAEWYAGESLEAPPGFAAFKARLFAELDPAFGPLLDASRAPELRLEEIHWGGVPVGGIPALDDPSLVAAADADFLDPAEPVIGIEIAGDARAYPLRILDWHELVNDRVGGIPIALAYCTLCGSAVAYDARNPDGAIHRFETSGLLYGSNKLMLDRETRSLWSQLTGRPVMGPLVGSGTELRTWPTVVTRFGDWRARHPDSRVLSLETGHERDYSPGQPYGGYFASNDKLFPVFEHRSELPPKTRIFGLVRGGNAVAYALDALVGKRVLNHRIGRERVVLLAASSRIVVEGESELVGPVSYDAGAAVRAYLAGDRRFQPAEGGTGGELVDGAGGAWQVTESALVGPSGERAERLSGTLAYWFAWQSFHPRTLIYDD